MHLHKLLLLLSFITTGITLNAQQFSTINGEVRDSLGSPIEFVTIILQGSKTGTTTNPKGQFTLKTDQQPPFILQFSAIGYSSHLMEIPTPEACNKHIKVILNARTEHINSVQVTATQRNGSTFTRIDPKLSNLLPDASGKSIEGLIKSQIGVTSNNELSSQYRVRGGNYDENLVYVNGIEIYRPFLVRSGQQEGLSFANPDMVSSILFSPGGFDVSYGDKLSSALDIRYKQPEEMNAGAQLSLLGASAFFEDATANNRFSHITGIRYKTNKYLLGSLDTKGDYSPTFIDIQSLLHFNINPRWAADLLVYYSQNDYDFTPTNRETSFGTMSEAKQLTIYFEGQEADRFQTGFGALALTHKRDNSQYKFTISGFRTFEEETYDILGQYWLQELDPVSGKASSSSDPITGIGVGSYLTHARNDLFGKVMNAAIKGTHQMGNHQLSWESKLQTEDFIDNINEWEMRDSAGYSLPYNGKLITLFDATNASYATQSVRLTAYAMDNMSINTNKGQLTLNYGMRFQYWDMNEQSLLSPRLNLQFTPKWETLMHFRLATGLYYQPPFYKELRNSDGIINKDLKAQESIHLVAGSDLYFTAWGRPFKFTSEIYYKKMSNLVSYQVDNVRIRYSGKNDAEGYAAGLDLKLNGEFVKGIESWASLSIMQTEEDIKDDSRSITNDDGTTTTQYPGYIPRPSDQRVNFALFFQDYLPNNPSFKVHLNLLFGTGLPFGPPRSERYMATYRTPPYRRADIGFSKDLTAHRTEESNRLLKKLWIGVEIFNMFDINNTISYYWVTDVSNRQYAVPNYLTSRRLNVQLTASF